MRAVVHVRLWTEDQMYCTRSTAGKLGLVLVLTILRKLVADC